MFTKTLLAASLTGLAAAAPAVLPRQNDASTFSLIAIHSGSEVQNQAINFTGQKWYIGKPTTTYCPSSQVQTCPSNTNISAVSQGSGSTGLSPDVIVPGGQQVYVQPDGQVGYTQAHSASVPTGSVYGPFEYTPPTGEAAYGQLQFDNEDFYACSTGEAGVYQIYAGCEGFDTAACIGINLVAIPYSGEAAWQYT